MATLTATAWQGETVDALVWRVLGAGSGTVEQMLDLNPGLADLGATLPEGHAVILPAIDATKAVQDREIIQLWD